MQNNINQRNVKRQKHLSFPSLFLIFFFLIFYFSFPTSARAQLVIPGTSVTFTLGDKEWQYLRTFKLDDGANVFLYSYTGELLVDASGDTVIPFLRIYVRENYNGDVYQLAYDRYVKQPFQSLREYTKGPGLPHGGLGYEGIYTSPSDGRDYRFLMTYFKDRRTAVEFRLETSRSTWETMKGRFTDLLNTVK